MSQSCACGAVVTGWAVEYGGRLGVYRCGGTHCRQADTALARALRELPATPTLNLARRVVVLEQALRDHGIALPPTEVTP